MDIVTYKLAQKYANKVAASFSSVRVDGLDIIFTLNDGKTATVTVPAPKDGKDGVDGQDGKSAYEVWLDEGNVGTEEDFLESIKGEQGDPGPVGPTGNGIASITKTATSGLVDTYTITYTNGNTTTFTITNGEDANIPRSEFDKLKSENETLKSIVNQLPQVEDEGYDVTLNNTIKAPFTKFEIEGNSTQDGTPSPDNEVPILSAGDNGSINEKIKNADGTEEQDYSIPVQQPMRSIEDIRDTFVKVDGKRYERHKVNRYIFTGNENWGKSSNTKNNIFYLRSIFNTLINKGISNYFIYRNVWNIDLVGIEIYDNKNIRFGLGLDSNITSVEEWKEYLQTQYNAGTPVYVDYVLTTPLDIECTEEQIQQLENKPSTYKEMTIINSEDETPAYLEVAGIYDLNNCESVIEELEADVDNIETTRGHVYGIRRKITNNSNSAWERIFDSVGKVANATKDGGTVQNDFDSLAPWSDIKSCNYDLTTKKINAWFGDANFKFDGTNGDVFTHVPKTYWKIYQEDDYDYVLLADYPRAGFMEVDGFFVGRYNASVVSDVLHSYSGLVPTTNKTRAQFRTLANALGNNFSQLDWRYFVLQMLYLVEYASYDSQSKLGNGIMNHTTAQKNGQCDSLGMKSGCLNNDGQHSVIYRGVENLFAHIWQFVDGINIKDRVTYICKDHSQYADNVFADAYKALAYTNASNDGWAKTLGLDVDEPFFRFPTETGGDSSDYMADYYFQNAGNMVARVGGNFNSGAYDGLWYWAFNSDSSIAGLIGCRVLIDNQ